MNIPAFHKPGDFPKTFILTGNEAHHAQVLRVQPNQQIRVFNGEGSSALCLVRTLDKKGLSLEVQSIDQCPPPPSRPILALAASKAIRRGFFMEKAAELGAAEIWVWQAERSVGKLNEKVLDGCRQQLIAGGKQSRNPWFPQLVNCRNMRGLLDQSLGLSHALRILPWEEEAGQKLISLAELGAPGNTIYVIGPEGGLTTGEVHDLKSAGFHTVGLGERVLRCETAAVLCLGLHMWASQLQRDGMSP